MFTQFSNILNPKSEMEPEPAVERPKLPLHIDSSMLASFGSCPRKYYWTYIHNLRPLGTNIHLIAGGAIAAALDAARQAAFGQLDYEAQVFAAYKAFSKAWGNAPLSFDEGKSYVNAFDAVELYLRQYPPLQDPIQPLRRKDGRITSEFTFSIPLPIKHPSGDNFIFTGRFDMLGVFNDRLVIVDEKTTGSLGASWVNQWKLRGQFLGYLWACQQLGYKVDTVVVRGIGLLKTQTNFLQAIEQYTPWMIDRWFTETCNKLHALVMAYEHDNWRYSFGDACTSYGGCAYELLCTANEPRDWFTNYQVEVWDPLHKT